MEALLHHYIATEPGIAYYIQRVSRQFDLADRSTLTGQTTTSLPTRSLTSPTRPAPHSSLARMT